MPEPRNLMWARIADANGYSADTESYFLADPDLTINDLLTVLGVWLGRLQDCSGGRVVDAQIRLGVDVSAFASKVIEDGTSVSSCLVLKFNNDLDTLPWNLLIPAVSNTVLDGGGPDMGEDATIDRLADQMENLGPTLAGFTFSTNRGGNLAPVASGFLSTRKLSKFQRRLSIRVGV